MYLSAPLGTSQSGIDLTNSFRVISFDCESGAVKATAIKMKILALIITFYY